MTSIHKYRTKAGRPGWRIYWIDYKGNRKTKVVYTSKTIARTTMERLQREAFDIQNGVRPRPEDALTLDECTQMFLQASLLEGKRPGTLLRYKNVFKPFVRRFGVSVRITALEPVKMEKYKAVRSRTVKAVSLNTELRHLKALFNWAVGQGYLTKSPMANVKLLKEENRKVRFLSEEEIASLYTAIEERQDQRAWDLVTFYLHTGARATEILEEGGFTWDSVKTEHIEIIGKGQKRRQIPLNDTLRSILSRRSELRAPFPYSYSAVSQTISRRLFRRAGFPDANLHTLRKTTGARLIRSGVDIYRVSKYLGHSSVKVTEQYYVDLVQSEYAEMSIKLEELTPPIPKTMETGTKQKR